MQDKIYEVVNQKIIDLLEKGVVPWRKSWTSKNRLAINAISKKPYTGINYITTNLSEYSSNIWATFEQWKSKNAIVKKGEKGTPIVFYKSLTIKDKESKEEKTIPLMRLSYVFNAEQVEGYEYTDKEIHTFNAIDTAEAIIKNFPLGMPEILYSDKFNPCYNLNCDLIKMPFKQNFCTPEEYYTTFFHEIVHSTGHKSRLNRKSVVESNGFGTQIYSQEELVAEIGASYLCKICGFEEKTIENSASYIASWLKVLKNDKKLIFKASADSQKAVDFLLKKQKEENHD